MKSSTQPKTHNSEHDWFKRFIDTATLLIITVGLYFAWDQASKLNESLETSNRNNNIATWNSISNQGMDLDKIFIANPGFQKYFFSSVPIDERNPSFDKASAIATFILDYFDSVMNLIRDFPEEAYSQKPSHSGNKENSPHKPYIERDVWNAYFQSVFHSSPLLCATLKSSWNTYGSEMKRLGGGACNITSSH